MKNKRNKIFTKSMLCFCIICASIASLFAPAVTFAAGSEINVRYEAKTPNGEHPLYKGVLEVSGNIGEAAAKQVSLMVLGEDKTTSHLNNDLTGFDTVVNSFRQFTTQADGSFSLSFGIGVPELGGDPTNGDYMVVLSFDGSASPLTATFYYRTTAHEAQALSDANAATSAGELENVVFVTFPKEVELDRAIYDTLATSDAQSAVMQYVYEAKEALKAAGGQGFAQMADLRKSFTDSSLLVKIKTAADGAAVMAALEEYKTELALTALPAYKTYSETLTSARRLAVCTKCVGFGGCDSLGELKAAFSEAVILDAIANAGMWNNIKPVLVQNKALLTAAGVDTGYYTLTDTSAVDKAIVGKTYAAIADLKDAINANMPTQTPGIPLGGNTTTTTGGGNATTVPAPSVTPSPSDSTSSPAQTGFADMVGYEWAAEAVNTLKSIGVVNGKTNESFAPADLVTREEFVKMLVSLLGTHNGSATADFADADKNAWYYSYVATAYANGIVNGIGDGLFGIGMNITRQDIATIACRALAIKAAGTAADFADDADMADYARESVYALASHGIISGMGDGSFAPTANATRAQAAKILYELYKWKESGI